MQGAAGEDQIVLANGTAEHDLDDPVGALERPMARTALPMTVRVVAPVAANTMVPLSVSVSLAAAAAGMAGAAEPASAVGIIWCRLVRGAGEGTEAQDTAAGTNGLAKRHATRSIDAYHASGDAR